MGTSPRKSNEERGLSTAELGWLLFDLTTQQLPLPRAGEADDRKAKYTHTRVDLHGMVFLSFFWFPSFTP